MGRVEGRTAVITGPAERGGFSFVRRPMAGGPEQSVVDAVPVRLVDWGDSDFSVRSGAPCRLPGDQTGRTSWDVDSDAGGDRHGSADGRGGDAGRQRRSG